jgi:hypothetical protein
MANLSIDDALFKAFRMACIERDTSASKEIARLIAAQLAQWQQEQNADSPAPKGNVS